MIIHAWAASPLSDIFTRSYLCFRSRSRLLSIPSTAQRSVSRTSFLSDMIERNRALICSLKYTFHNDPLHPAPATAC